MAKYKVEYDAETCIGTTACIAEASWFFAEEGCPVEAIRVTINILHFPHAHHCAGDVPDCRQD